MAEGARLESVYTFTGIGGSNPSLSAITKRWSLGPDFGCAGQCFSGNCAKGRPILSLEAYLFGAFHHRFNRALRKERRRQEMMKHLPLSRDLERLRHAHDSRAVEDPDRSIQVKQTIERMDDVRTI